MHRLRQAIFLLFFLEKKIEDPRCLCLLFFLSLYKLSRLTCFCGEDVRTYSSPSICFPRIAMLIAFAIPRDKS